MCGVLRRVARWEANKIRPVGALAMVCLPLTIVRLLSRLCNPFDGFIVPARTLDLPRGALSPTEGDRLHSYIFRDCVLVHARAFVHDFSRVLYCPVL